MVQKGAPMQAQEILISNTAVGLFWLYIVDTCRPPVFRKKRSIFVVFNHTTDGILFR